MLRKHPAMTDVAVRVLKVFRVRAPDGNVRRYRVKVEWWNIGRCHPPYSMGLTQTLTLLPAQWAAWQPYAWTGRQPPRPMEVL